MTAEQFLERLDRTGGASACWPWTGRSRSRGGYGAVWFEGSQWRANRLALTLALGRSIAPGLQALHSCDNAACCNPGHLREGTPADNVADALARGRIRAGERVPNAKLTEARVREARAAIAAGIPTRLLARVYRVHRWTLGRAVSGRTWRDQPSVLMSSWDATAKRRAA